MSPHGFLITWGTYGARLHGSAKPHVDMDHNDPGSPLPKADLAREASMRERMKSEPVKLAPAQRNLVETAIIEVAVKFGWTIHAIAVQSDHIHVVVTATREGPALREALKASGARSLNAEFGKRKWWSEGGSTKYLWERPYFENAVRYVLRQRDW